MDQSTFSNLANCHTADIATAARILGIDSIEVRPRPAGQSLCHLLRLDELYRVSTAGLLRLLKTRHPERLSDGG